MHGSQTFVDKRQRGFPTSARSSYLLALNSNFRQQFTAALHYFEHLFIHGLRATVPCPCPIRRDWRKTAWT